MLIASFDIGTKNFACCIEEFDPCHARPCFIKSKYNVDGTLQPEYQDYLEKTLLSHGTIHLLQNVNISGQTYQQTCTNMYNVLQQHLPVLSQCSVVLIEKQMTRNNIACKLAQHCYSYFIYHAIHAQVIEFPAMHKTKVLGAPKKMTKYQRKKWAVEEATRLMTLRNDETYSSLLATSTKRDDMSDAFLQLQAYKCLSFAK